MSSKCTIEYRQLFEHFPLRPIKSKHQLDIAIKVAKDLYSRLDCLSRDESDYLDVLTNLIETYEREKNVFPTKSVLPIEMLNYLLEVNNLKQVDLARILKVESGRASEIVNGIRPLSKAQIAILSDHFKVSANLFLEPVTA